MAAPFATQVAALTRKNLRRVSRNLPRTAMLAFSCLALLGATVLLFLSSGSRTLAKGKPYAGLNAFFRCKLQRFNSSAPSVACAPDTGENREFSVALYDVVRHHGSDGLAQADALALVSDVLLSGMPVLGLDDYLTISDTFNAIIGARTRAAILKHRFYGPALAPMLNPRSMQIDVCCGEQAQAFVNFLAQNTLTFKDFRIRFTDSLDDALADCCAQTWAIIELFQKDTPPNVDMPELVATSNVTYARIHMHPYALPDIETTILRFKDRVSTTLTGPVLYQTSGFLTLQFELHKYLELKSGGHWHFEPVFRPAVAHQAQPNPAAGTGPASSLPDEQRDRANDNGTVITKEEVERIIDQLPSLTNTSNVPYFTAAFPQQLRRVNQFWQNFSETVTVAMVLLMCIPAVLVVGLYQAEKDLGVIQVLQTVGVPHVTSVVSWWCCGSALVTVFACAGGVAFSTILQFTQSHVLTGLLLLLGFAMLSAGFVISFACPRAEYATFGVPVLAFVLMLPGLLYFELAESRHRLMSTELSLAILPPSGFALAFLTICDLEEQSIAATWMTTLEASNSPLWAFALMLFADIWLYALLAWLLTEAIQLSTSRLFRNCAVGIQRAVVDPEQGILLSRLPSEAASLRPLVMRLQDLHKTFYLKGLEYPVLNGVSVDLLKDEVTCLLGSNGAGKTTLMKILAGVDARFSGDLSILEVQSGRRQIGTSKMHQTPCENFHDSLSQAVMPGLLFIILANLAGYCPQVDALFDELTVQEHVSLMITLSGHTSENDLLEEVALQDDAHKLTTQLSGGMKRRLSMAMALVGNPLILILDEPTSGVDALTRRILWRVILSRRQGRGLLLSTHHTDDVETVCDRLWFVSDAKILYSGTYAELSKRTKTTGLEIHLPATTEVLHTAFNGARRLRSLLEACQSIAFQRAVPTDTLRLRSVTANAAIVRMYELLNASPGSSAPSPSYGSISAAIATQVDDLDEAEQLRRPPERSKSFVVRSACMIWHLGAMRVKELARTGWLFLAAFIVLPALVALLISSTSAAPLVRSLPLSYNIIGPSEVLSCPDLFHTVPVDSSTSSSSKAAAGIPSHDIVGCEQPTSGALLTSMFADYYAHTKPRWGAFVFDDHIRDFLSSSATISINTDTDIQPSDEARINELIHSMNKSVTLTSNVTILTNITAPHSLPIFFAAANNLFTQPYQYLLESHPFPIPTCTEICLERGYKAATLVLVLFFIIPIISVRVPLQLMNDGAKLQLQLAGASPLEYWITHSLLDGVSVFLCAYITYLGALAGGAPVSSFLSPFDQAEDGWEAAHVGAMLLAAFSLAAVTSSFTACLIPVDPIPVQLTLLVLAVANGLFAHYFLSLQSGAFTFFSLILFALSPSYVLGDAFFSMFAVHVQKYSGKPVGILSNYSGGYRRVRLGVQAMLIQAAAYFTLTLVCEVVIPWARAKLQDLKQRWGSVRGQYSLVASREDHVQAPEDFAIAAANLSSSYDHWPKMLPWQSSRKAALTEVSFSVPHGSHVALLGINGGGKTTFFRAATGEILPTAGSLRLLGLNPYAANWMSAFHVGYCPQFGGLLQFFTVEESLAFFSRMHELVHGRSMAERSIQELFPSHMRNHVIAALSGGNKRKLSVLQADAGIPSVLLLDEPTTGVDPVASEFIVRYLRRKSHMQTIVFTSHNLDECAQLCEDVVLLNRGKLRFHGRFREFLQLQQSGFTLLLKFGHSLQPVQLQALEQEFSALHAAQIDILSDDRVVCVFLGETISEFDTLGAMHGALERALLEDAVERLWIRDLGVEDMIRVAMG